MTLPPYARLLGVTAERDAAGGPILVMPFAETVVGRPDYLHGGAIGGLLELAAHAAVVEALAADAAAGAIAADAAVGAIAADAAVGLIGMTVDYRRGGGDRPTSAHATVTRLGRRVANVDAVAWQEERDRPIASARLIFAIDHAA